jgi:uncharacterized repeat protein (TIGR03843 family)
MRRRFRQARIPTAAQSGDAFWRELGANDQLPLEERSALLHTGEITAYEVVPWGSNYTFLVALADKSGEPRTIGIYKPRQGEAPLWDFPDGTLYQREYAAYRLSRWLGWDLVPETIIREDGPYGVGTVQMYIEPEDETHYFSLRETHADDLRRMALFDLITNNADRKGGHLFKGKDGKVYGIDHGLTFNTQPKLRTVIWDFTGEPIPDTLLADLDSRFGDEAAVAVLRAELEPLLTKPEIDRFFSRAGRILRTRTYPGFGPGNTHHIPYGII